MKIYPLLFLVTWWNVRSVEQPIAQRDSITFSALNAGFEVTGTVKIVSTEINFDPQNLEGSLISALVDPSSLETGISVRDKHLKRSDYFDVAKYPQIQLKSQSFKRTNRNAFIGEFDLTMKGITKRIELPFTVRKEKNGIVYETRFEIDRLDFDIGEPSAILDNKVVVMAKVMDE